MKASVFGLGYVGAVTSACLARDGHEVIGVDIDPDKVRAINSGTSPMVEPGLDRLISDAVATGRLRSTADTDGAVRDSEISIICVGTPTNPDGSPNLEHVYRVCREIGRAIAQKRAAHVVVLRSTVPPGTFGTCMTLMDEAAGGERVLGAFMPEFLREGSAIADHYDAPYTLIGSEDAAAIDAIERLFEAVDAPLAEMVKYVSNAWHAVKVTFANEIARLARAWDLDGRAVMEIAARDTKLNVSPAYLRPGFAYGGSCLPKDLNTLLHHARRMDVPVPMLSATPGSNALKVERVADAVKDAGARRVLVLGLAFKPGTDDLRNSPSVRLVRKLLADDCSVSIFDPAFNGRRLTGSNLEYIRGELPEYEGLLTADVAAAGVVADVVVVTQATEEFRDVLMSAPAGTRVIAAVGLFEAPPAGLDYSGPSIPVTNPATREKSEAHADGG